MADLHIRSLLQGSIFDPGERNAIIIEELRAYLTKASKALEAEVATRIPVNTGVTRGALFSQLRGVDMTRGEAIVSLPVEYADAIEFGTKPHFPPIAPIELWVRQRFRDKGGSLRAAVTQARSRNTARPLRSRTDAAIKSLAFAIATTIARRGTKAHRMFALAQKALERDISLTMWDQTCERIATRLSDPGSKAA